MAIEAGVSDRLVRLEEEKGRVVAELFRAVIEDDEAELSDAQQETVRKVAARHLRAVPGGAAA